MWASTLGSVILYSAALCVCRKCIQVGKIVLIQIKTVDLSRGPRSELKPCCWQIIIVYVQNDLS